MSLIVLCTNGRRVTVKTTPNTSVLKILEEACKKQGFDPDLYDLKHHRRVLDVSSTVRFANLPNNCVLEMVEATKPRTASIVTVNVSTEAGLRLMDDFPATATLREVLSQLESKAGQDVFLLPPSDSEQQPLLVYSMQRISHDQLDRTTLKSLGLVSGKCMFRYSLQSVSTDLGSQAHVSKPLSKPKPTPQSSQPSQSSKSSQPVVASFMDPQPSTSAASSGVLGTSPAHVVPASPDCGESMEVGGTSGPDIVSSTRASEVPDVLQPSLAQPDIVSDQGMDGPTPMDLVESTSSYSRSSSNVSTAQLDSSYQEIQHNVIKLGSHDAILFNMDDAPPTQVLDEGDDFFEMTTDEVKKLYKEQVQYVKELENAPLMTKQLRECEENSKVLTALNRYPVTQLRIQFPDQHVIQANFKPLDTIQNVKDFLRPFLEDQARTFTLNLRHPNRVLDPSNNLVSAECVPKARIYIEPTYASNDQFLNKETLDKKSSFLGATGSIVRNQSRGSTFGVGHTLNENSGPSTGSSSSSSGASVSGVAQAKRPATTTASATGAIQKTPKWFKCGK